MIAFVGLGNPGDKYKHTKHNAGFWVLDEMAQRHKVSFKAGKGDYVMALKPNKFLLFKPTTGMNKSGYAIKDISNVWNFVPKDLCVIIDDVDLPLGSIRIKPRGGDGSHRGLENIIYSLNTDEFPRLRFGIGTNEKMRPAENYVLKPFNNTKDKKLSIKSVIKATDALDSILFNGLDKTMNTFNS